ncbi:MAG: outer membrane lipoprotein LolB [Rubrivivax sp.]|nr:outer membrane lipoprotein LolB [Rubrivivax sp.]
MPPPAESPWTSGRLTVRVDAHGDQAARQVGAAFDLRGDGDTGELRLSSPLGTLLAQANWSPGAAVLRSADGETRYPDLDTLSRQALGEALPLRALPDWLAGRPWPGAPSQSRAEGFDQLGWSVTLARLNDGWIDASRAAPPAVSLRVRLERPQ